MTNKQIIVDEINKTIEQEMENLRNIAKQQIGKLEAKLKRKEQECEELYKQLKQAEHNLAEKDKEIERLKQGIKHYQRGMFSIINTATECRNNKQWNYK